MHHRPALPRPAAPRGRALLTVAALLAGAGLPAQAAPEGPSLIGRQGRVAHYLVPTDKARDVAWHEQAIEQVCAGQESCFARFYTNSRGAAPGLPLPDAIADEPTVMFQRSAKHGGQLLRWSCRLEVGDPTKCF